MSAEKCRRCGKVPGPHDCLISISTPGKPAGGPFCGPCLRAINAEFRRKLRSGELRKELGHD
jgi:hypothetical protein